MREILVKNLTSEDKHSRRLHILEKVEQNGVLATSQRQCLYFLREKERFSGLEEMKNWLALHQFPDNTKIRYLNIVKSKNTSTNEESLTYKIAGRSYLLIGAAIFCVFFTHTFKVEISRKMAEDKI